MEKTIEMVCSVRNGQPSVQFRVTEVVEGNIKEKIQEMMNDLPEPIANSMKNLQAARLLSNDEVNVYDVPFSNQKAPTSKRHPFKSGGSLKITEKQLWCIKDYLENGNIDEKEFCLTHGVDRLEDLPKNVASGIVSEIKNQ